MAVFSNIYKEFAQTATRFPHNECVAVFDGSMYKAVTYHTFHESVKRLACGFRNSGLVRGDVIAVMLDNGPGWVLVDLASAALGITVVPIHTTYGIDYVEYIVKNSLAKWLITSEKYRKLLDRDLNIPSLERIVTVGVAAPDDVILSCVDGLFASSDRFKAEPVSEHDLHTIVYTSGTTGKPKGVMLSHRNILSNVYYAKKYVEITHTDRFFSFMPLSHAFERTAGYYVPILSGAAIYYARSKATIINDIGHAEPTVVISVPRIFEKVHEGVLDRVKEGGLIKQKIFHLALNQHNRSRVRGDIKRIACWMLDRVVLRKIRSIFGGRLRFAISGGAPLGKNIIEFFNSVGIVIVEGYGLTEASPIISINKPLRRKIGTVGFPLLNTKIRILDGEILVKGDGVMAGYYRDEKKTAETLDKNGWLHTGDLGFVDDDGFLTITGRKKDIIVLSTGKNVAPVPIEKKLEENDYIHQTMVYGDTDKILSAFIVPHFENLKSWCKDNGIDYTFPDIVYNKSVVAHYQSIVNDLLRLSPPPEQVKRITLLPEEFTQENDLLTPTLKLKRGNILASLSSRRDKCFRG